MTATSAVTDPSQTLEEVSFPPKKKLTSLFTVDTSRVLEQLKKAAQTGSLIADISRILEQLKDEAVSVRDVQELQEYLLRFPDTIEALEETVRAASNDLPDAQLVLELYHDPEIEDEHLVLYARFKNYPEDVMDRIRSVREKCRGSLIGKKGWVHLTTDFSPVE